MLVLFQIISIFILGLIGGANPGPLLISCCSESLRLGFSKGFKTILWGLISETTVGVIILLIIFSLNPAKEIFYAIGLLGGIFLIYIAWQVSKIDSIGDDGAKVFTFWRILFLTILNGPFWLFWVTICAPLAFEADKILPAGRWLFIIIFEVGWLVATALIAFIFSRFKVLLTKKSAVRTVYIFLALILIFFAAKMIITSSINLWQFYG